MKILALETSAVACSVALCEDEKLLAQSFQNNGLTHSVTLMPMCQAKTAVPGFPAVVSCGWAAPCPHRGWKTPVPA